MANIDQEHNQDEEHQTNPGLDQQLLSALLASSMDFGNIGKPPASIVSIQELDEYEVDATFKRRRKEKNEETCAICSDEYELNQYVKQMPCKHFFHTDCLHEVCFVLFVCLFRYFSISHSRNVKKESFLKNNIDLKPNNKIVVGKAWKFLSIVSII